MYKDHIKQEPKIYYINLDSSMDREKAMRSSFKSEELIRIKAIDGLAWSDNTVDEYGRYNWKSNIYKDLVDYNIIASCATCRKPMSPLEVACNLSHLKSILAFLKTKDPYAIILEDDVQPTSLLKGNRIVDLLEIPKEADMVYLCDQDHPGRRLSLYESREVKWPRTLMGYWLTRKAAFLLFKACFPMCWLLDTQGPTRLFKSLEPFKHNWVSPELEELPRFKAFGLTNGLIEHSEYAKITTFTKSGKKLYLPKEGRIE